MAILDTIVVLAVCAGIVALCALDGHAIPRLAQLALLIGALWACFLGADIAFRCNVWRPLPHILMLAAVVLFGADIVLIARAYHIGGHYPDGFLLCTLGALALTALVPSEPVAIAGFLLAGAWSSAETFGFWGAVHWPFLIVWLAFMGVALWRRWIVAHHFALLALVYWCMISVVWRDAYVSIYLIGLYVPIALGLALLAGFLDNDAPWSGVRATMLTYSLILFLIALFGLGFRALELNAFVIGPGPRWIAAFLIVATIVIALIVRWFIRHGPDLSTVLGAILALVLLIGLAALFFNRIESFFITWSFKAALAAAAVWIVLRGYKARRRAVMNIGLVFVLISIVRIYIDTKLAFFSSSHLLSGAISFVIVTGVVLIVLQRKLRARWVRAET